MTRLSSEQILQENEKRDPVSITAVVFTHRALSDISCLNDFNKLERLDLSFNNISSLEGLRTCTSLKWLSVSQNRLESLKGIEGLSKLTVLNASRNKLRSMDEVRSLISLRALILNDNEIISICSLDSLKDLNTLVLSRNPICDIGESLIQMKLLTKLSLSNCQIQAIGSSLKSCVDLKELRLAHNEIMTLPVEIAYNTKLQNLDLGNNLIASWSVLKVLSSLHNLRILNIQGNPIAEKDKLAKKIQKAVPNLQIFNARPIEKSSTTEVHRKDLDGHKSKQSKEWTTISSSGEIDGEKDLKQKKRKKTEKHSKKNASSYSKDDVALDKEQKKKPKGVDKSEIEMFDDGETPFADLVVSDSVENSKEEVKKMNHTSGQDVNLHSEEVILPGKRKKFSKSLGMRSVLHLSSATEIGLGGPSTWED